MIGLNLLSPAQKNALHAHVLYAMIERLMVSLVISVLIGTLALLAIRVQLSKNLNEIETRQILSSEYVTVNDDVRALNQQIGRVETLQRLPVSLSALLLEIAERTPKGVSIAGIDVDLSNGQMRLAGIAAKREHLLAYEEALKGSPFVKKLDSPISNLFQKTDVNFQFLISLQIEEMKKKFEPTP